MKQFATQRKVTQRSRFTRKSPVVAAATLSPQIYFYLKFWAPPHHFLLGLIVKFLSLLGVSYFHFTLKMDVIRFTCLVQFWFESWMFGLLVEKKKIFVLQSFLFGERTNLVVPDP